MPDYSTCQNPDLLRLIFQDDKTAFTELYKRYWKRLFAIAYCRLKEKESAEDIVHDVFASLWQNRREAIAIESLENYLAVSTKYSVLAVFRKRLRDKNIKDKLFFARVSEPTVEASLHFRKILELVKTETENLPEKCRLVFKYSRIEGMPVKKIAAKLKISPKTAENQLAKAVRHLKLAAKSLLHTLLIAAFLA